MPLDERKFVSDLRAGDILSRPLSVPGGDLLFDAESQLSADDISQIDQKGLRSVYVKVRAEAEEETAEDENVEQTDVDGALSSFMALTNFGDDDSEPESMDDEDELAWDEEEDSAEWEKFASKEPQLTKTADEMEAEMEKVAAETPVIERTMVEAKVVEYDRSDVIKAKKEIRKIHHEAVTETRNAVGSLLKKDFSGGNGLRNHVKSLVDIGLENTEVFGAIASLENQKDPLLSAGVSSALYSSLIGNVLGFSKDELYDLAECALLHDIGMRWIAPSVTQKPGKLSLDDQLSIQKHTIFGCDLLHGVENIAYAAHISAYQHHERWDGSGYPKGRKGARINEYARIVGMTDVFAAMTAPRAHRAKMVGYDAMKWILSGSGTFFDPTHVKAFLRVMSLYPVGSIVKLTNGTTAIVVAAHPRFVYRPQVKIKIDANGKDTGDAGDVIDLAQDRTINIDSALTENVLAASEVWNSI